MQKSPPPPLGITCWCLVLLAGLAPAPAEGSTFVRLGLEELTAGSNTIVLAEVLDTHSYWSPDETFILTDVRISPMRVLKGHSEEATFVVTLPGGTVGDLTTLIVGAAGLEPGHSYVLFLRDGGFAGVSGAQTVPEHSQGVFEVVRTAGGLRAVSQAVGKHVLPDAGGDAVPPGGRAGLPLDDLLQRIEALTGRGAGRGRR